MVHVAVGSYRCEFEVWTPGMGRVFPGMFAFDTETTEINEQHPDHVPAFVLGTASDGKRGVLLNRETVLPFLLAHTGASIICHNAAFDLCVTQRLIGNRLDLYALVDEGKVWDTLVLKRLLSLATEGHTALGEAGLANCVKDHLGLDLNKAVTDGGGRNVRTGFAQFLYQPITAITADYLRYAAADSLATWHLFWALNRRIRDVLRGSAEVFGFVDQEWLRDRIQRFGPLTHHVQVKASIVMDVLRRNGIGVDPVRSAQKLAAVRADKAHYELCLRERGFPLGGEGAGKAMQATLDRFHAQNPDVELRRTSKSGKWSTAKEDLAELAAEAPVFRDYAAYRAAEKLEATYLSKMNTARLYAKFNYLLTTGRTSCGGGFNLQNLPKELDLLESHPDALTVRGCFVPRDGHVFIDADYSQIELVVLAYLLAHQFRLGYGLAEMVNSGQDVHRLIASTVLHKPPAEVTKKERNSAKPISFGRPGGMGVEGLRQQAKESYGQDLTTEEVQERIAAYHRLCPELNEFLRDEVDSGLVLAEALDLTPAGYHEAMGNCHSAEEEAPNQPQSWLGGMLLKVLRDANPITSFGQGRAYSLGEINFFWDRAQQFPGKLTPELAAKLHAREPDDELWRAVRNWAGRRAVFTVTGRLRANAQFCSSRNCVFQGAAADGAILALWKVWRAGYRPVNAIHDQLVIECPADDRVLERKRNIERLMVEGMREVVPDMRVNVETVITRSLDKRELDVRFQEALPASARHDHCQFASPNPVQGKGCPLLHPA